MTLSLLVVTPHPSFGELIRQTLEETGNYRVYVSSDEETALACMKETDCATVFLDMDLDVQVVQVIGHALREINPDLPLVIISGDDEVSSLEELLPWTVLRKPFYLPDLLRLLGDEHPNEDEIVKDFDKEIHQQEQETPVWMGDVTKAAQHLTRLTLESAAQAALVTQQNKLWAYAGQLSQEAANELASIVTSHWDRQNGTDLLRFVRLDATQAEHMLYATLLEEGAILALVFDAETPFGTIRSQANRLIQSMSDSPPAVKPAPVADIQSDDDFWENEGPANNIPSIADILDIVPPPNPDVQFSEQEEMDVAFQAVVEALTEEEEQEEETPEEAQANLDEDDESAVETRPSTPIRKNTFSQESSPAIPIRDLLRKDKSDDFATQKSKPKMEAEELDSTLPSASRRRPSTPVRRPDPGELDETRPHSVTEVARRVILEPVSPSLYNLTYACLLVPRFSSHYLTGDLADHLSEWLPQICVAFGWRLEFQAVRPEYLQWVVNVPPATSPGYLMRVMRQQTSERIFGEFSRFKKENPSGDFWAPGYLIMGGTQPHPPQLVKDYLKQTRQRQGLLRNKR